MNLKQQLRKLRKSKFHGKSIPEFCKALSMSTKTYYEILDDKRDLNNVRVINTHNQLKEVINALNR